MPAFQLYHLDALRFGESLAPHFGVTGIGIEAATPTWPSDSLFAALVAQAAQLGAAGQRFIDAMAGDSPPLRHSSLFPRIGGLVLLPRPALELRIDNEAKRNEIGKGFKKVKFLSPNLFKAVCANNDLQRFGHIALQNGEVWLSANELDRLPKDWQPTPKESHEQYHARLAATKIWKIESIPHVAVDRASSASAYYEAGRVFFAPQCGLALLTTKRDDFFEHALELLGEGGIGGKRTVGYGAFTCNHVGEINFADGAGRVVTLSRFLPRDHAEIEIVRDQRSRYQLVEVGGWATPSTGAAFRRKEITMLAEGAVLAKRVRGCVVDVRSDTFEPRSSHDVWRSGLALTISIDSESITSAPQAKEKRRGKR